MFIHKEMGVSFHVHVDDLCAVGPRKALHFVFTELSKVMLLCYTDVVQIGETMKHVGDEYERTQRGWIQRPSKDYVKTRSSLSAWRSATLPT